MFEGNGDDTLTVSSMAMKSVDICLMQIEQKRIEAMAMAKAKTKTKTTQQLTVYFQNTHLEKSAGKSGVWRICYYTDENGERIRACGNNLPRVQLAEIQLFGEWQEMSMKIPKTFKVIFFKVLLPSEHDTFVDFVKKLGVGLEPAVIERLYQVSGEQSWQSFIEHPELFAAIEGLSENAFQALCDVALENRWHNAAHEVLGPVLEVTPARLASLRDCLSSIDDVYALKKEPYRLLNMNGFRLQHVEALACAYGVSVDPVRKIDAAMQEIFRKVASFEGHTCLPQSQFFASVCNTLSGEGSMLSTDDVKSGINTLCKTGRLHYTALSQGEGLFYEGNVYAEEVSLVAHLKRLQGTPCDLGDVSQRAKAMAQFETEKGLCLTEAQKKAIEHACTSKVSIIVGASSTGKTVTMQAIKAVYKALGANEVIFLAPIGRAAMHLREVTGSSAVTVHHALYYDAKEETVPMLRGDGFIISEASMLDLRVTSALAARLPSTAHLIFVGDRDKLPSIGVGHVFEDLIQAHIFPVTVLDSVFNEKTPLVRNMIKIRKGCSDLENDATYRALTVCDSEQACFQQALDYYTEAVERYGVENVMLLNAYRKKDTVNVDAFNKALQIRCNPIAFHDMQSLQNKKWCFYQGDRVMVTKNLSIAKNGDLGTIVKIWEAENGTTCATVCFDDGEKRVFDAKNAAYLDLAYSTTVHKSQGARFQVIILVIVSSQAVMNNQALVYTAYTMAEKQVMVVTDRAKNGKIAFDMAIRKPATQKRYTFLNQRLKQALQPKV